MRKKKAELDSKNTSYSYLKQLRDAFLNENQRRYLSSFDFLRIQLDPISIHTSLALSILVLSWNYRLN